MLDKKPEILSPAGSLESLYSAVRSGADAVYVGGASFSARANAKNFTHEELCEGIKYCHLHRVKVYQAINTIVTDDQLEELMSEVEFACRIGVDALITQDLALCEVVQKACPDLEIHASTQMTLHSESAVELADELGFSRIVVAREVSKAMLGRICDTAKQHKIEVEAFVHGALCMSVSGQCYMSAMFGSRSANRGQCAQACRLPFSALGADFKDRQDLSLKDLSLLDYAKELGELGVNSLKIEGRMKRPEYVSASTDALAKAVRGEQYDSDTLRAVFSRSGFTDGYYTEQLGSQMFGTRQYEDVTDAEKVLPQLRELYRKERKSASVDFHLELLANQPTRLLARDSDENTSEVFGDPPQTALTRSTDLEQVQKQLSKLGSTIYELGTVTAKIGEGLAIPASSLNDLRRRACEKLDEQRICTNTKICAFDPTGINLNFPKQLNIKFRELRIEVSTANQLSGVDLSEIALVALPIAERHAVAELKSKLVLALPRFIRCESELLDELKTARSEGFDKVQVTNLSQIPLARKLGFEIFGDFGLNVTNSLALKRLADMGVAQTTVSFELKTRQINALGDFLPYGVVCYGRLPLMLTVNCPRSASVGSCSGCKSPQLIDRKGAVSPIKCSKKYGYVEILNSQPLWIADMLDEFYGASFFVLKFFDEAPSEINRVVTQFLNKEKPSENTSYTRGLYKRGII